MNILVTGGAGFIGSHLVDALVSDHHVTVVDNLSAGMRKNVNKKASFVKRDLLHDPIDDILSTADMIYHLAANPDVRLGSTETRIHLDQNVMVTYNLLEAMRKNKIDKIAFTSSSTIYGSAPRPTPETYGPLVPESLYGASKLACEALITAYCHSFGMRSWIFRLANIIGERSDHGILVDFKKKLSLDPRHLEILGDGLQEKSYLHVSECVRGMIHACNKSERHVNIFNIGSSDTITVNEIAKIMLNKMGIAPEISYTGGSKGWLGDIPAMLLSMEKMNAVGFIPKYNSRESIELTLDQIL